MPTPLTISWELLYQGKSLGRVKAIDARHRNGTWTHKMDFTLPADATPRVYILATRISTGYGQDQKRLKFMAD